MKKKVIKTATILTTVLMAGSSLAGCGGQSAPPEATYSGSDCAAPLCSQSSGKHSSAPEISDDYFYSEDENYYPQEYNTESYEEYDENGFCLTAVNPLSTFAADVDTASYSNVRRMIENGYSKEQIDPGAVRAEEFINYFSYDLNDPEGDERFGFTTEVSKCPWNEDHMLMFVGMKTEDIDVNEMPDSNLVFLIDVSGSMSDSEKLPLLQKSFNEMLDVLPENSTISIVTYASTEEIVLDGESVTNRNTIKNAINSLHASGSTNGERGIQMAYEIALENYIEGGNNRVIMATDGDLNVGISDPDELEDFIKDKKDDGVFLSVLGFGMGNYKDDRLERLADCGNGNYSYIDSILEARKVMVENMGSTLVTVAKDVKLQMEFNPERVNGYRLIGYENRALADTDFADDTKDGGEIGAGHSVVALYEFIPADSDKAVTLKYGEEKENTSDFSSELATLSVRYKEPEGNKSDMVSVVVDDTALAEAPSENIRFAGMVAEFAMLLSDSDNKGTATFDDILSSYKEIKNRDEYRDEFNQLVRTVAKRG